MKLINVFQQRSILTLASVGSQVTVVGTLVLLVVALFLVPLPPQLLDLLIVSNLVLSLSLLLSGLFVTEPMKLFAFPTIVLLTTLYRLALNVSSTRLILLYGDQGHDAAGKVIQAFGRFVVQGDFVVGAIIFAVIATVNFLVIARGSARVAEVAARFTLDALPGKQLAIDSDMRAGNITVEEASERRQQLNRESQFYGAMDGSMKFVQGDAIATLIITFINAIGGVSIGISRGLSFSDSVDAFGVLTIGDGLVSILPALLVSVCAGIVVTHVAGRGGIESGSGSQVVSQLTASPQATALAAASLIIVGLLPGFPFIPFFVIGALILFWLLRRGDLAVLSGTQGAENIAIGSGRQVHGYIPSGVSNDIRLDKVQGRLPAPPSHPAASPLNVRRLLLEVDADILGNYLANSGSNSSAGGQLFERFSRERRDELYRQRGVVLPVISLTINPELSPGHYRVSIREEGLKSGVIHLEAVFIMASAATCRMLDIPVLQSAVHPIDCRNGVWVPRESVRQEVLERLTIEIFTPAEFLVLEVIGAALQAIDELFGLSEVKELLQNLRHEHRSLIDDVLNAGVVSQAEFSEIIKRLVRERVNVRDLKLILESVVEFYALNPAPPLAAGVNEERAEWITQLHGFIRGVLARSIVGGLVAPGGGLRAFVLSKEAEDEFRSAASSWRAPKSRLPVDPEAEIALRTNAKRLFQPVIERGALPVVLLCAGEVRLAVQEFFARDMLNPESFRTVSYEEIGVGIKTEPVGVLGI